MKKILAFSIAVAAFTFSVSAQEKRDISPDKNARHEKMHKGRHKEMFKDLKLTEAQKLQMKSVKEDKTLSREARKAKMDNIFTSEQKAKLATNRKASHTDRKAMHKQKAKEMQSKLGLSDEQSAKLKVQNEANHAKMKALKGNSALSKEDKKAQIKAIKASAKEQRKSILTSEQLKKMDAMKKEGKGKHQKMNKQAK